MKACKNAEAMRSVVICKSDRRLWLRNITDITSAPASFLAKLKSSLVMGDEQVSELTPLVDLGVDSLVAVELRGWFSHEVGADVALMKILGGSSAQELVDDVLLKVTLPS